MSGGISLRKTRLGLIGEGGMVAAMAVFGSATGIK
jgi:hypothetical protein